MGVHKYDDLLQLHSPTENDPVLVEDAGTTSTLCKGARIGLKASEISGPVPKRVKHLMPDEVACGLAGGNVPWSAVH